MARSSIPDFGIEYPEYVYRPFPKQIGLDEAGEPIEVMSDEEAAERADEVVYPKVLGKDKNGKDVIAATPRDEWRKELVAKTSVTENALTEKRGPGRPPKVD